MISVSEKVGPWPAVTGRLIVSFSLIYLMD